LENALKIENELLKYSFIHFLKIFLKVFEKPLKNLENDKRLILYKNSMNC
jgi:hypothetical protein